MTKLGICQNCDIELSRELIVAGKLFCSEKCTQTASTVRYGRSAISRGVMGNPDVRDAIRIRILHIINGGYPEAERRLRPEVREFVFQRDNHECQIKGPNCTGVGDTIDHIAGSSPDPSNLRAACKACNMGKFFAFIEEHGVVTDRAQAEALAIHARIRATEPTRLCDDEQQWNNIWRDLSKRQKQQV